MSTKNPPLATTIPRPNLKTSIKSFFSILPTQESTTQVDKPPIETNSLTSQTADKGKTENNNKYENFIQPVLTPIKDNFAWGDSFASPKQRNHFRLYSNNINTIRPYKSWTTWDHGVSQAFENSIDCCCLQETNIVWTAANRNRAQQPFNFLIRFSILEPCRYVGGHP